MNSLIPWNNCYSVSKPFEWKLPNQPLGLVGFVGVAWSFGWAWGFGGCGWGFRGAWMVWGGGLVSGLCSWGFGILWICWGLGCMMGVWGCAAPGGDLLGLIMCLYLIPLALHCSLGPSSLCILGFRALWGLLLCASASGWSCLPGVLGSMPWDHIHSGAMCRLGEMNCYNELHSQTLNMQVQYADYTLILSYYFVSLSEQKSYIF